jgi:hypothetical protein
LEVVAARGVGVTAAGFEAAAGEGAAVVGARDVVAGTGLVDGWVIEDAADVAGVVDGVEVELQPNSARVHRAIITERKNSPAFLTE